MRLNNIGNVFCIKCGDYAPFSVGLRSASTSVRGTDFKFFEEIAICDKCGEEVYVPRVNDNNVDLRHETYLRTLPYNVIKCRGEHVCCSCGTKTAIMIDLDSEAPFCSKLCLDKFYDGYYEASKKLASETIPDFG